MEEISTDFLVVGGGIAGITFAEYIKKLLPYKSVSIIEKEPIPAYSRVLLPHYVKGLIPREKVFIRTAEQIENHGVIYFLGEAAQRIDYAKQEAFTRDKKVRYQTLVLAMGGTPNKPESQAGGHYLQTLHDADKLIKHLNKLPLGANATIIGGGFIALEFMEIFKRHNLAVTNLAKNNRYFSNVSPPELSDKLKAIFKSNNITTAEKINKEFDIIGIGVGLDRKTSLVPSNTEIKTDRFLKTRFPNVYSIGDAAIVRITDNLYKATGNWSCAAAQGKWLAEYLSRQTSDPFSFKRSGHYTINFFGNTLSFMGLTEQQYVENQTIEDTKNTLIIECRAGKKTVGGILLNASAYRKELEARISL